VYRDGSMVTLVNAKEHFDGQDTLKLGSGVCGMIVQSRKKTQGEPEYVVDFGAYGRWNCLHGELNGDDPEGWDKPQRVSSTEEGMAILDGLFSAFNNNGVPSAQVWNTPGTTGAFSPRPAVAIDSAGLVSGGEFEASQVPAIDFEADMEKRMKELEREIL